MWEFTRVIPQLPAKRFDKHLREVLVGIGSNRITIERDGTARAMTLSEAENWLDLLENLNTLEKRHDHLRTIHSTQSAAETLEVVAWLAPYNLEVTERAKDARGGAVGPGWVSRHEAGIFTTRGEL